MLNTPSTQATILIIDDEAGPRDALKMILRPFYNLCMVDNGHAAMRVIKEQPIDLVTLDLKLPDRQGADLLQEIKLERPEVEVIIITGYGSLKSAVDGVRYGAAGYLLKPFNVKELITLINQTMERKRRLDMMRQFLKQSEGMWAGDEDPAPAWRKLREQYPAGTSSNPDFEEHSPYAPIFSDLLEAKDRHLLSHSSRVSFYAGLMARELNLPAPERKALVIGGFLHDIGKVGLPHRLIAKRENLTEREQIELKRHVEIGARLIGPLRLPAEVGQIISYHHERYDGSGYPEGLQGEGIPVLARVVSIVQAFDHLTTDQAAQLLSVQEAGEKIRQEAGTRFDPRLTDLFARVASEGKAALPAATTGATPARRVS
jgi:putative nucleotidyltransferase with HDIG domain